MEIADQAVNERLASLPKTKGKGGLYWRSLPS
jgi:hypothetical protein